MTATGPTEAVADVPRERLNEEATRATRWLMRSGRSLVVGCSPQLEAAPAGSGPRWPAAALAAAL